MADRDEPQRADALRNRRLVIEAGLELLTEDPNLGMQEIADASGLGRTTVYRHFSNREELVDAVFAEMTRQSRESVAAALARGDDIETTIRNLGGTIVELNRRLHRFMAGQEIGALAKAASDDGSSPTGGFLRGERERGEIRDDMPIHWQLTIMQLLATEALEEVEAGAIDIDEAKQLVGGTLVSILRS